jgi:hypothetical protein
MVFVNVNLSTAQNPGEIIMNGSFHERPLKEFFDTLEVKHNLRVFYKQEWITNISISKNFINTPLIQALNNIFVDNELTFRFYQDNGIIIFPEAKAGENRILESAQILIIGNPLNYGRYKTATLRGKVSDGQTGEPLVGAVIYHAQKEKGASTDSDGLFELELPTGDHQIRFSYMGFEESVWNIRIIEDGYEEFGLFEESHAIGEVIVVGKEADLPRSQMSLVQMSSVEIKQLPALMGEVDVLKSITMMAGVQSVGELHRGLTCVGEIPIRI